MLFHAPQSGHLPTHLLCSPPHCWQTNFMRVFGMKTFYPIKLQDEHKKRPSYGTYVADCTDHHRRGVSLYLPWFSFDKAPLRVPVSYPWSVSLPEPLSLPPAESAASGVAGADNCSMRLRTWRTRSSSTTFASTRSPGWNLPCRRPSARGSSTILWMVRRKGRAPY